MKRYLSYIAILAFFQSCTKTETTFEKRPYKTIERFALVGYTGDSITAVVKDSNIIVYWADNSVLPATITPNIVVAEKATIAPASGTAVAFDSTTVYTVTAEDGTTQRYRLKTVINIPVPKISSISPNDLLWISSPTLTVKGEYFLTADTSDVHVYAQRLRDGYEFDLVIDTSKLSMTQIIARLPAYTEQMDTGMHRIYVKVGNRISDEKQVRLRKPDFRFTLPAPVHFQWLEAGQTLQAGDSLTLRFWDDYDGNIVRWYAKQWTGLRIDNWSFDQTTMTQTESTIKVKIPDTPLTKAPSSFTVYIIDPFYNAGNYSVIFNSSAWPTLPVAAP